MTDRKLKEELIAMSERSGNWGGARPGAGRPSLGKGKSVVVGFKVAAKDAKRLEVLSRAGESIHAAARRLMLEAMAAEEGSDE